MKTPLEKFKNDVDAKLATMTPAQLQGVFEDAGVVFPPPVRVLTAVELAKARKEFSEWSKRQRTGQIEGMIKRNAKKTL